MNYYRSTLYSNFKIYSPEHYIPFILCVFLVILISYFTYKLPVKSKIKIGVFISIIPIVSSILNSVYAYYNICDQDLNQFIIKGLPLHACHFIGLFNLIGLLKKDRRFLSLAYFWCMSFNILAMLMPELVHGFPSYLYLFFFITHCGSFIAVFYSILALNLKPSLKDLFFTIFATNVFLFLSLAFNKIFDTNYSYVLRKPITSSILDMFGEWPFYLVTSEFVGLFMFFIFYKAFDLCVDNNKVTKFE